MTCSSYTTESTCETASCCWCSYPAPSHCQTCPCGEPPAPPPGTPVFRVRAPSTNNEWVNHDITVATNETFYLDVMLGCPRVQGAACANDFGIYDYTAGRWYIVYPGEYCCENYCDRGCLSKSYSSTGNHLFMADSFLWSSCGCSVSSGNCLGCTWNSSCNTAYACDDHPGCPEHVCAEPTFLRIFVVPPNSPPTATSPTAEKGCIWPLVTLYWNFSDPDTGDFQSQYQIQIDDNSSFSHCTDSACSDGWYNYLSTEITTNPGTNSFSHQIGEALSVRTLYSWRIKVKDNNGNWSGWLTPIANFDLHPM